MSAQHALQQLPIDILKVQRPERLAGNLSHAFGILKSLPKSACPYEAAFFSLARWMF
jgi:hypothetical protein